jgi:hypothetical protein
MKLPTIQALLLFLIATAALIRGFYLCSWEMIILGMVIMWIGVYHWNTRKHR